MLRTWAADAARRARRLLRPAPTQPPTRHLPAPAGLLDEGSFGTRAHGKRLLWHLARLLSGRADVERLAGALRAEALRAKVLDVALAHDCPAVAPPSRGASIGAPPPLALSLRMLQRACAHAPYGGAGGRGLCVCALPLESRRRG